MKWRLNGTIVSLKLGRSSAGMSSLTGVLDPAIPFRAMHPCAEVWQVKPCACDSDRNGIARIQAEKPHARFSATGYVRAYIQLGKRGEPGKGRSPAQPHAGHAKWDDRKPCLPVKGIDLHLPGDLRLQRFDGHRPMRKQQILPFLLHDPWAGRHGPGAVRGLVQNPAHEYLQRNLDNVIF